MDYSPKTFNIYGTEFTLKYVDELKDENDEYLYGRTDVITGEILISKTLREHQIPESELEITTLHEILHAITIVGQYLTENDNEPLIEWLARSIISIKKQGIL